MGKIILDAINITKKFPGVLANDNVCLNVEEGEILGLIGENGAGKSTLLKVLNGIYPHGTYTGQIMLDGKELTLPSANSAIESGIGFVPQEINVLKNFSVAENIYMSDLGLKKAIGYEINEETAKKYLKDNKLVNFKLMYKATQKLLDNNGIDLSPKADVRKLSIGQQQMLMIARALASHPKVLILDESTTSLSDNDVKNLFRVVQDLKKKGTSIIFVTHKLDEIMELTDRVTILRDGKNISTFRREEYDKNLIIHDMIGRELTNMYPTRNSKIGDVVMEVKNLTVAHPYIANKNQVEDVSFRVRAGEVLGLAGLVGAGRSEVCMAIYGVSKVKSGEILINNKKVNIDSPQTAVRNGIGLISEDRKKYGLNFVWDIQNNIGISNLKAIMRSGFVSRKKLVGRTDKYYRELRIKAPSLKTKVGTLSGGNQQKVVIARTLNTEPKVFILDEPTKGIDVGSKNEIYGLINDMVANGVAVIMISSELPELMAMSDRFIVMAEGRVAAELSKEEATTDNIMRHAVVSFKNITSSNEAKETENER